MAYEVGKPVVAEEVVDGVGPVNALCRWWSPAFHVGTVAMFRREGFKPTGTVESLTGPTRPRMERAWPPSASDPRRDAEDGLDVFTFGD